MAVLYHGEAEWCDPEAMPFEQVVRPLYDGQIACRVLPADVFGEPERYKTKLGDPLVVNGQALPRLCGAGGQADARRRGPGAGRAGGSRAAGVLCGAAARGFVRGRPAARSPGRLPGGAPGRSARRPPAAGVAAPVLEPKNDRLRLLTVRASTPMVLAVNEGTAPCTGTLTLPGLAGPATGTTPGPTAASPPTPPIPPAACRWMSASCRCSPGSWCWARRPPVWRFIPPRRSGRASP